MALPKVKVKGDQKLNRLYITLVGGADEQKTKELFRHLNLAISRMRPGFTVLTNMLELERLSPSYLIEAGKVMKIIKRANPGRVARVVNPIIGIQMNRVGQLSKSSGVNFKTLEEAIEYLDENEARVPGSID